MHGGIWKGDMLVAKVKLSGRDQVFRKPTSIRGQPQGGDECKDDLRGESDGFQTSGHNDGRQRSPKRFFVDRGDYISLNQWLISCVFWKNLSQYRWDTLTSSGKKQTLPSMCCKEAELICIGTSMTIETYQNLGLVSRTSQC